MPAHRDLCPCATRPCAQATETHCKGKGHKEKVAEMAKADTNMEEIGEAIDAYKGFVKE